MFVTVSYDIPDDKRRNKIARTLKDYGERIQYSVFECNITNEQYLQLLKRITNIVLPEKDTVRFYRLCKECKEKIRIVGLGKVTEDEEVYVI